MAIGKDEGLPPLLGASAKIEFDRLERRARGEEKPIPVAFKSLARRLGGGFWPSLNILAGPTGSGKTQLALQLALCAAEHNVPVVYVGLESGELEMITRVAAVKSRVQWSKLLHGKEFQLLTKVRPGVQKYLKALPLHFEPGSVGWRYPHLLKIAEAMRRKYPAQHGKVRSSMILLDFLQIIGPAQEGAREELRERIGRAAYIGAEIARTFDATVILLSSVARDNYDKFTVEIPKNRVLPLSDASTLIGTGKESGEIEYAADNVFALCRGAKTPESVPCFLAVAKVRAGVPGWVALHFMQGSWFEEEHQFEADPPRVSSSSAGKAKENRPRLDARDKGLL
jgi:replicative DNA helicase